jgi:hypothetical protein
MAEVLFSRPRSPGDAPIEIRLHVPRAWADLLDGHSMADGRHRNDLVARIIGEWVKAEAHRAMLIHRTVGGNPALSELAGERDE